MPKADDKLDFEEDVPTGVATTGEDDASAHKEGVVQLGGSMYAVGLMWQPLQDPDAPLPEIKVMAESDPDLNLYCLVPGVAPQYGLGRKKDKLTVGMPVLAASLASYFVEEPSICGVFKLEEGWWFITIRNNLIMGEKDVLYKDEEEAKEAFKAVLKIPDWNKKFAPADWEIPETTPLDLEEIIGDMRKIRLTEITTVKRTRVLIGVIVAIVALVIFAAVNFVSYLNSLDVEVEKEILPVVVPVKKMHEEVKNPWTKRPQTDAFISKCWNNIFMVQSVIIPGWKLGDLVCTPQELTLQWTATGKGRNMVILENALASYKLETASIQMSETGNTATGSIKFTNLPYVDISSSLGAGQLQHELLDFQQGTGLPITFKKENMSVVTELGSSPDKNVVRNYVYFTFDAPSEYSPWEWLQFFNKFDGLELKKITYRPDLPAGSPGKWHYEGRIYAN